MAYDSVMRIDAPFRYRVTDSLNEAFMVSVGIISSLSTAISLLFVLIHGFLDEYSVHPGENIWLLISAFVFFNTADWAVNSSKHTLDPNSVKGRATNDYNHLNKDHKALCKDALVSLYRLDNSTQATIDAQRERRSLIEKVLEKQRSDAYKAITIDNSDIIALREYVGMKGIN